MKKVFVLLILLVTVLSCNKKEVKVPKVAMQGAEEVANNSVIWMFYGDNGKRDVNEKNRISATNWFFNIDKKLALKEIIPQTNRLLIKHNEKSPHNTKPMKNYFTYVNSLNNHLSFYQFDSIQYKLITDKNTLKFTGDTLLVDVNSSTLNIPTDDEHSVIQPVFDGTMNFQEYLETKALFNKALKKSKVSRIEYITTSH